ncbi:hypothetical protein C1645_751926 [Glomus cerebriforme]|uniref:Uncharacterized protein n=1 Tax=Glomus cerebriforme TaxID=658196 RepID=A0A397TRS9_9GLOM|nr:hypothetical protein C1645_751926 [Glomus cerebriforme]
MYTISSFSPDTARSRLSMNTISSSSLRRIGTIKLLILATVIPIMIITIINPMWICIFMKNPHVHRKTTANAVVTHGGNLHVSNNNVHTDNVSHAKPQTHTHTKSYKGGIKVTKEMFDIIVASKDGRRIQELETTITVIENVSPSSKNQHNNKQISQHDINKKEKVTNNFKAHGQINKPSVTYEVKNNDESIIDKIRGKLFKDRNSCAYVALSIILLCAVTVCGILCLSSDNGKAYESVNDDDYENLCQSTDDHYVRIEDDDIETSDKLNENNFAENKLVACVTDCNVQIISSHDTTSSPPPYSSNINPEFISISNSSENIQQTDEN